MCTLEAISSCSMSIQIIDKHQIKQTIGTTIGK